MSSIIRVGGDEVFAGRNTSNQNGNGTLIVRPRDGLVPLLPPLWQIQTNGVSRGASPIGQPSPLGARLQFDATDPNSPAYARFMGMGTTMGFITGGDIGDNASAPTYAVSSITYSGTTATVTFSSAHRLTTNQYITVSGATPTAYNGSFPVRWVSSTVVTYLMPSNPGANASGYTVTGTYTSFQPCGVYIDGEPFPLTRTDTIPSATTPFTASNQRLLYRTIMEDLPEDQYPVEIWCPGDRLNTTGNRLVVYAVLVDPKYYGIYGGDVHLVSAGGSVPTSMSTVNPWSNTGSQPLGILQIDICNTSGGALTCAMQYDGSNTRHFKTIQNNDTVSLFSVPRPSVRDVTGIKLQASGSGLTYVMHATAGF